MAEKEKSLFVVMVKGADGIWITPRRLVRASTGANAVAFVAHANKANANAVATLMAEGVKIEEAE